MKTIEDFEMLLTLTVSAVIPVAGARSVKAGSIFLSKMFQAFNLVFVSWGDI